MNLVRVVSRSRTSAISSKKTSLSTFLITYIFDKTRPLSSNLPITWRFHQGQHRIQLKSSAHQSNKSQLFLDCFSATQPFTSELNTFFAEVIRLGHGLTVLPFQINLSFKRFFNPTI